MPEGICNKCGEQKELVLAGCVCSGCVDRLDREWASSTATDWVLICWNGKLLPSCEYIGSGSIAETWPSYTVYRNTSYARMKLLWATWSEQIRMENGRVPPSATSSRSNWQPDPDEVQSLWQIWSTKPDAPFIRPASADELRLHNTFVEAIATSVTKKILAKWGFDDARQAVNPQWGAEAQEQAAFGAVIEIRNRLEEQGMLDGSEWDSEGWRAALAKRSTQPPKESFSPARGLSQVAGMADLKEQLMHEVIGPFKNPELYRRYRVSLPNGILFYGPPGCGKTYIARSLAEELGWSFQYCRPSDVASPYIHDTVSRIRAVFSAATEKAPSIVFIDEFEAFVPARSELGGHQQHKAEEVNEFLANLEGCAEHKVLVIAATNEPEKIDPAVRRSGRFDKLIFIAPPDAEARRSMLEFHLRDRPVEASLDTTGIATSLDGYSASDIKLLVEEASRMALKRAEAISTSTLLAAIKRVPASITTDDVQRYSAFRKRG
jgi:AAA+ superfamily predicted ATPase